MRPRVSERDLECYKRIKGCKGFVREKQNPKAKAKKTEIKRVKDTCM